PEPLTLAFKESLLTTSASPEPVKDTSVWLDSNLDASKSPDPETLTSKLFVEPVRVKSPDPDKLLFTFSASIFRVTFPEPAKDTSKLEAEITFLFLKSPEPARDTFVISLNGMVILIVSPLLGLRFTLFFCLLIKLFPFTSVIMYSNRFSSPSSVIVPSVPDTRM